MSDTIYNETVNRMYNERAKQNIIKQQDIQRNSKKCIGRKNYRMKQQQNM